MTTRVRAVAIPVALLALVGLELLAPALAQAQANDDKKEEKPATPTVRPTPRRPPAQPAPAPVVPKAAPATPAKPSVEVKPTDKPADKPAEGKPGENGKPVEGKPDVAGLEDGSDSELYKCKDIPDTKKIQVTLKPETEFKELVTWAMGFTCQNFIYSSGIASRSGKVTVIAPSVMTARDAWKLFLVALQTMNLTIVPKGRTMEIVETGQAKERPIPIRKIGGVPDADQMIRVLIRPEHMSVEEMQAILQGLRSKDGIITPIPNAGVIIVTDYGSSIEKMVQVVRELDEPTGAEKVYIVRVQYADATEIATKLSEIFGIGQGRAGGAAPAPARAPARGDRGGAQPKPTTTAPQSPSGGDSGSAAPSKIIPDERTNSLIIISSERGYQRILALIKRLDIAIEGGEGRIHVYYLNNADAEELSNTLNGIASGSGGGRQAAQRQGAPQGGGGGAAPGGGAAVFEGNVRVTHDKPTNSLVIVSSVKDFLSLRDVVRKLDIPRRQVFVEATILEVSLDKTRSMGIAFHGGAPIDVFGEESLLFAGSQHGAALTSLALSPSALSGLAAGILGPELEQSSQFLGVSIPSFGVMFQLLQSNNDVNILSSPHILTTDNEPAEISVGQNIPYQSGSPIPGLGSGAGGAAGGQNVPIGLFGGFGQIQRHDVVLKMKLTPHINESNQVRFELEQEISDILAENFGKDLGPVWSTRTVKTMITVSDQQPVVIGGLMSDKITVTESKVPLLGDIPILGYLFKHTKKQKIKTNLLILLTPYIIHDQSDLRRIFEKKVRERREFVETFTTFDPRDLEAEIDYTKKHGFLETINQAVRMADEDDRMAAEAEEAMRRRNDEGPVNFPDDFRDNGGGDTAPTPPPPPPPAPEPRID